MEWEVFTCGKSRSDKSSDGIDGILRDLWIDFTGKWFEIEHVSMELHGDKDNHDYYNTRANEMHEDIESLLRHGIDQFVVGF